MYTFKIPTVLLVCFVVCTFSNSCGGAVMLLRGSVMEEMFLEGLEREEGLEMFFREGLEEAWWRLGGGLVEACF